MLRISAILLSCVLFSLTGCFGKRAEPAAPVLIERNVLLVFGNGVDQKQARSAFYGARHRLLTEAGIKLNLKGSLVVERAYGGNPAPGEFIRDWKEFLTPRIQRHYDMVLLTLPADAKLRYHGQRVSGFSEGIGVVGISPNALAYSIISGERALDAYIMVHELGHLLGAQHEDGGIMSAELQSLQRGFTRQTVRLLRGEVARGRAAETTLVRERAAVD